MVGGHLGARHLLEAPQLLVPILQSNGVVENVIRRHVVAVGATCAAVAWCPLLAWRVRMPPPPPPPPPCHSSQQVALQSGWMRQHRDQSEVPVTPVIQMMGRLSLYDPAMALMALKPPTCRKRQEWPACRTLPPLPMPPAGSSRLTA